MSVVAEVSGYWREEDARGVIEEWRASGLTMAAFARQEGVNVKRLQRWRFRLDHEQRVEPRFVSVAMESGAMGPQPLCIVVGDLRVEVPQGFHEETLLRVIRVLSC
jgi:hypothetical protein